LFDAYDAVLFSVCEYERLSVFMEYLESLDEIDMVKLIKSLPKAGKRESYSIDQLRNDIE